MANSTGTVVSKDPPRDEDARDDAGTSSESDAKSRFAGFDREHLEKLKQVVERFWPTVKKALRAIPFIDEVVAAYFAMLDPQTPLKARLIVLGALLYFVTPFDLVPDLLLGIGFLDDASILAAAIASIRQSITPEHREAARRALSDEEPGAGQDGIIIDA